MVPESSLSRLATMILLAAIGVTGCSDNERVAEVALTGSKRQADLDQEMIRLNREVAAGTQRLIEAQGQADQQALAAQRDLQKQRDALETERRQIAEKRASESLLAPILLTLGSLVVCSLPLVLCWYLLRDLGHDAAETEVFRLLIDELIDDDELKPWDKPTQPDCKLGQLNNPQKPGIADSR
jgi:hypothetical protein